MQTTTDHSYGVIPLYQEGGLWQVLLIEQIGRRGDTFWTFPKGHPEDGETPPQSAQRELVEETGIKDAAIATEPIFTTQYTFVHEGIAIHKQVDYFLGYCTSTDTAISQPQEVSQLRWCSLSEAHTLLSHTNTQELLSAVMQHLDDTA